MLVGVMTLLLGLTISNDAFADCGGYVIIGNKAKLRELQKKGFAFGSTMKSHSIEMNDVKNAGMRQSNTRSSIERFSSLRKNRSLIGADRSIELDSAVTEFVDGQASRPTSCSGPNCRSKSRPMPQPVNVSIESPPSKPLKAASACYEKRSADSYFGHSEYSESPFLYKLLIDRPPQ